MTNDQDQQVPLTDEEWRQAGCDVLARLDLPVWLYDFDAYAIVWANDRALTLWNAASVSELFKRNLKADMSPGIDERLRQFCEDFQRYPTATVREQWTLYPGGRPHHVECVFHDGRLRPGRRCTLVIAQPAIDPASSGKSTGAQEPMMHSRVMTGLYSLDGERLFVNRLFRKTLGIGSLHGRFGDAFTNPAETEPFLAAIRAGRIWRDTIKVETADGQQFHDIEVTPCRDPMTGQDVFQGSSVDVTQIAETAEALDIARDQAERANAAKSEFIASMSHEMRTPMNGVLGLLEVLRHTDMSEKQAEMVRIAQSSGVALLELIDDVLDISSIELNAVSVLNEPFDPVAVANMVIEGLSDPASRKGLTLSLDIDDAIVGEAMGDGRRVGQVMRNLVSNAIKYTHQGGVTMKLSRWGKTGMLVEVRDTGPGIPAHRRDDVFNRFHQEPQSNGRRADGVGLGLAICKEIVGLWDGEISVGEAPGGGASFAFTAPNALAARSSIENFGEQPVDVRAGTRPIMFPKMH